jgi:tRNA dimethylallyltransferase
VSSTVDFKGRGDIPEHVPNPDLVLIAGPTASGKSALALALAEERNGVVINADSMQVYRDLRLITARPTPEEEARAPHRLYGHVDAGESYSVGRWLTDARAAIEDARRARRLPVLVGGTGLYFKALTHGLSAVPPVPQAVRDRVQARLAAHGVSELHAELERRDPASAGRLRPNDRTRVTRALEVLEATGRSLLDWHREELAPLVHPTRAVKIFLTVDRAELTRRIEARFDTILGAGALDEVRALDARGLDPRMPAMKAHGVPWLRGHLRGEIPLSEAAGHAKADTRRYAKRQLTWFRHQLPDWTWVAPDEAARTVGAALAVEH